MPLNVEPNIEKISYMVKEVLNAGIDTMIGMSIGDDTVKYFKNKGILYTVIKSEEISIIEAIQNACRLYEMILKEREKKERLQAVLNFSSEGIISVDENGNIMTLNPKGEKILILNECDVIGKYMDEIVPDIDISKNLKTGEIILGKITSVGEVQIITDIIPIIVDNEIVGAVATFRKTKEVQKIEQKIRYKLAQRGLTAKYTFKSIVGNSNEILTIVELAKIYSKILSTVLITGETGSGKEVFAQAIHNESDRKNRAFVAINCSALPLNLLESELFGYSDGAFTGARKGGKQGLFELAHKGTIFLDEIGEMDRVLQSRLLRVIQEREIMRIGDDRVIPIDVRIIAATNIDLYESVQKGNFRLDLYFRLNVLNLHIPPLRERKKDIVELVEELIYKLNKKLNCKVISLDHNIMKWLMKYDWPGNIRELQNIMEKIIVISKSGIAKFKIVSCILNELPQNLKYLEEDDLYNYTLKEIEKKVIIKVLKEEGYNKTKSAQRLGINRNTLNRKLTK